MINTAYGKTMFWDGRAPSLEGQAQGPLQNPIEMGKQSYKEIVERLRKIPGYAEQFQEGLWYQCDPGRHGQGDRHLRAGGRAVGKLQVRQVHIAGDNKALSESEKRGMVLFGLTLNTDDDEFKHRRRSQKAKCTLCHAGFNFTDEQFHNLGVGWNEKTGKFADLGRWAIDPDRRQD